MKYIVSFYVVTPSGDATLYVGKSGKLTTEETRAGFFEKMWDAKSSAGILVHQIERTCGSECLIETTIEEAA